MVTVDEHLLLLVVYNVQRTRASTTIRGNTNLIVLQVLLNGDLRVNILSAPQALQGIPQLSRIPVHSHPNAVQENLGESLHVFWSTFHQVQHTPFFKEVLDDCLGCSKGNPTHERDVLHQSHCLPFGRFCRTHQAPVGVVKLPRLHQLSGACQGRDHAPQMRQSGHEGQSIQPLRDACANRLSRLVLAPVACRKLVLHTLTQAGCLFQVLLNVVRNRAFVECTLQHFPQVLDGFAPKAGK
eukprot:Skav204808  [mRNA]  locus=scaffold894:78412:79131:- [translate_table: standard]